MSLVNWARQYVDQLDAHMDEGGATSPNNVRDMIEMVRKLTDKYRCAYCETTIDHAGLMYRCVECDQPFHKACIREHFNKSRALARAGYEQKADKS